MNGDRYVNPLRFGGVEYLDVPEDAAIVYLRGVILNPAAAASRDVERHPSASDAVLWHPGEAGAELPRPFRGKILSAGGSLHAAYGTAIAHTGFTWALSREELLDDDDAANAINADPVVLDAQRFDGLGSERPCDQGEPILRPIVAASMAADLTDRHVLVGTVKQLAGGTLAADSAAMEIVVALALWSIGPSGS